MIKGHSKGDHLGCWLDHSTHSHSETSTSQLVMVVVPSSSFKPLTEDRMGPEISLFTA